jgi:hypothetical protein
MKSKFNADLLFEYGKLKAELTGITVNENIAAVLRSVESKDEMNALIERIRGKLRESALDRIDFSTVELPGTKKETTTNKKLGQRIHTVLEGMMS